MKPGIRASELADVHHLQNLLREADMVELRAQKMDSTAALMHGYFRSYPHSYTITVDDEPVAMYGVVPGLDPNIAAIWLLGSDKLLEAQIWFLRNAKGVLEDLISGFDLVHNVVHEDNEVHIRWLRWMGFSFLRHTPPFHEFAKCVTQ